MRSRIISRSSEQAVRAQKKNCDKDDKRNGGAPFTTRERNSQRFGEPDNQSAEHRAHRAANAAENRRRKKRQQEIETHRRADLNDQSRHDPGEASQTRAENPNEANDLATI